MKITSREGWGARPAKAGVRHVSMGDRSEFVLHHSDGPADQSVRAIQDWCMDHRGFLDIDYNFLVRGTTGQIYAGRGWTAVGSHALDHNVSGVGVCVIGRDELTAPAKIALRWLYADACRAAGHALIPLGHRDVEATACPGTVIYRWMQSAGLRNLRVTAPAMRGEDVRFIQLKVHTTADGIYGVHTAAAVMIWQRDHELVADGIVGPKTRASFGLT